MSDSGDRPIERVAFLGLGVMGGPMAGHLARAGYDVTVYNRTRERADAWAKSYQGRVAATPAEAADGAQVVFTCVGRDEDLREVALGDDGAFAALADGAVFVDHTTVSAEIARELSAAAGERGAGFVDAPVSGGQAGAENGKLAIMCGGDEASFARAEPVMQAYGARVRAHRRRRRRPAHQDGQPDLHRRPGAGPVRGRRFRPERPGLDIEAVSWRRSPRAPRSRGRWTTARAPWPRAGSTSASP
ncbi:MAG: NAD(P)-dependent oxidoreductase [Halofilum sp. (in: g-proteobacteria)]|nr:NAD(P)-dependent oxidoreductase [Halofilum sp. (in: g-proteobacteria)]